VDGQDDQVMVVENDLEKKDDGFQVVYEYTAATGGWHGNRFRTYYRDEAHFKECYTEDQKASLKVVGRGVSEARALELLDEVPMSCKVAACMEKARSSKTGEIRREALEINLANIMLAQKFLEEERTINVEAEDVNETKQLNARAGLLSANEEDDK